MFLWPSSVPIWQEFSLTFKFNKTHRRVIYIGFKRIYYYKRIGHPDQGYQFGKN